MEKAQSSTHGGNVLTSFKQKQGGDKFWKIATILLVLILAIFAFKGVFGSDNATGNVVVPTPSAAVPSVPSAPSVPTPTLNMAQLVDDDPVLGNPNAPVTIIEFSDYECPFCGRFYSDTLGQIKSQYIDTGKVKFVYRDFPLSFHLQAEPAAIAANCAGEQGKYFEYHDLIFSNGGAAGKTQTNYESWATQLGLDVQAWKTCTLDPAQRQEVQKDMADGAAAGVRGTPGFVINGQLVSGAQPFSVFQQIIEAELQ
jgi:protein-disulfide isomerase